MALQHTCTVVVYYRGEYFVPGTLLDCVRMWVQPEAIKVPVQVHAGDEDAMKGLSDPEVTPAAGLASAHCV